MINAWVNQRFEGGQATDKKVGLSNSFAYSQSLDFRKSPSQFSVLPHPRVEDSSTVTDLIQNEVMTESGVMYALGSSGNVYHRTTQGVWSLFGNVPDGTFGVSYRKDQDAIYFTSSKVVSQIVNVSTAPVLSPGFYNESKSTYNNSSQVGFNVNSDQMNGNSTVSILTTFDESDAQRRYFQTDIQPINKIGVYVVTKGSGDWTMTVHDGLNRVLGTSTILNADLVNGMLNNFTFTPMQVNVGPNNAQTYHFHLTSTNTGGTIRSTGFNDMATADMQLYADRLATTSNGIHPMVTFQQFECIGNGRYLSVWEPLGEPEPSNSAWQRQKLSFPPGYEVCGLDVFNEYLVIATERTTTGDETPQDGIIFYWDGLADTYNYFTKIPEGSPEAIHEYENVIYYVAGGSWYAITSVAATPQKIRRLPGSENVYTGVGSTTRVYPYAATTRHGIQLLGYPSVTDNQEIPYGVYSWGKTDYTLPNSFGYSYLLSTGSQFKTDTNNLTIGMVKNFGNLLHISWRDGNNYGIDIVDVDSKPAPYSTWESLIFDNKIASKEKLASQVELKWLDAQDGVEFVLKYSLNRGEWQYSDKFSNSNQYLGIPNYARFDIGVSGLGERAFEAQIGIDIYCDETVTQPPTGIAATLVYDSLNTEKLI